MENNFKYYNTQSSLGVIVIPLDNINHMWSNVDNTLIFFSTTGRWVKTKELYNTYDEAKKEEKYVKIKSISDRNFYANFIKASEYKMNGIELIKLERERQINSENFSEERDMEYIKEELAYAAVCYAIPHENRYAFIYGDVISYTWPKTWGLNWWKPTPDDMIKELTKAGALIAAEIDRLLKTQ